MSRINRLCGVLAALLLRPGRSPVDQAHADWARAMRVEAEECGDGRERLAWAFGCWSASLVAGLRGAQAYRAALALGVALLAAFEWSCDEGLATTALVGGLSLALGVMRPTRAVLSGGMIGLVVAAVLTFEACSGMRPAYEQQVQTLADGLRWSVFLAPALVAAVLGGCIGRRLNVRTDLPCG